MKKRLMKKLAWALAVAQIFTVNPALCVSAEEADTAETVEVNAPASEEARFEDVLDAEAAEDVASSESEAINDGLVDPEDPNIKASGYFSNGETGPYYALYNDGRMVIEGTGEISFFAGSPEETEFKNALSWAKTVTVESGITGIPYGLFKEAPVLESVTLPDSVTSMGSHLFDGCNKLNSVRLPQGYAEAIPAGLFRECVSLKNVTIPAGVTGINESAFQGSGITSINIPKNVLYIETAAFETCYNLTAVTGGEGLSEIKNNAFNLCSSLSSFNFGDNIKTIGASAFYECALNFIYVPGTVENLGENCFANNYADTVIIGDGVTRIPANAFAGCNGFGILYLPSSVTYVGNGAFNTLNSSNVKNKKQPQYEVVTFDDVFFGGSEAEFQKAFEGNTENHSVLDCPNIHYNSKMPILYTVSFD
ncbi:MAG: leucine-rich repeat domain-containing protein, partial [Lachnospiraceae bacterium]|nr:leucine-rich repeat domain-containing protein [Lachnospiraceae bacterium]